MQLQYKKLISNVRKWGQRRSRIAAHSSSLNKSQLSDFESADSIEYMYINNYKQLWSDCTYNSTPTYLNYNSTPTL